MLQSNGWSGLIRYLKGDIKMTRKRFVKLMMSDGWCRDMANDYAITLIKLGNFSYRDAWNDLISPELTD